MKLGNKLQNNKGFSLAEVLIVIAIIIVLTGFGAFSVVNMIENSRQTAADKVAQSIAETLQARLQEIYAFESDSKKALETAGNVDSLAVLKEQNGRAFGDTNATALNALTENGQVINSEFYKNGIAVDIDVSSFRVLSVYYTSDTSKYGIDAVYSSDSTKGTARDRKSAFKGYAGYFGSDSDDGNALLKLDTDESIIVRVGHFVNGERRLYNYDELIANLEIAFFPTERTDVESKIVGRDVIIEVAIKSEDKGNGSKYIFEGIYNAAYSCNEKIVLDSFKDDKRFSKIFASTSPLYSQLFSSVFTNIYSFKEVKALGETAKIFPGENIKIEVNVSTYIDADHADGEPLLSASSYAYDNTLFAYDNGRSGDNYKKTSLNTSPIIYVSSGRHLQNLDISSGIVDTLNGLNVDEISVAQIDDIDFDKATVAGDEKRVYWKTAYAGKYFTPITNNKISSFTGLKATSESSTDTSYKISNLKIDETKPEDSAIAGRTAAKTSVGLFEEFAGKNISNLNIENATITGPVTADSCVGTVAGKLSKAVSENKAKFDSVILTDPKISASHTAKAGGLVGYSECELEAEGCKVQITGEDPSTNVQNGWIKTAEAP